MIKMRFINIFLLSVLFVGCKTINTNKKEPIDSKKYRIADVEYMKDNISAGQLTNSELTKLKNHLTKYYDINLDSISYLSISYLKSRSNCWYDNYIYIGKSKGENAIEKYRLQSNSELLFLHHDKGYNKASSKYDVDSYIYNLFPTGHGNTFCDYTVTISKYGDFLFQVSHFDIKVANAFRNELENYDITYRN